jgi:hypothetical protein
MEQIGSASRLEMQADGRALEKKKTRKTTRRKLPTKAEARDSSTCSAVALAATPLPSSASPRTKAPGGVS